MTSGGRIVVIGVGNRLRGDDGIGPIVLDRLGGRLPAEVKTIESSGDPVNLLTWWHGARLAVVVDGVAAGGKRGTVYRFNGDQSIPAKFFRQSSHLIGLADAVELGRELGRMPHHLIVFGIEVGTTDHGADVTDVVSAAGDDVVEEIVTIIEAMNPQRAAGHA